MYPLDMSKAQYSNKLKDNYDMYSIAAGLLIEWKHIVSTFIEHKSLIICVKYVSAINIQIKNEKIKKFLFRSLH